nr:heavy metal-associated domain-containing protein [Lysinibacillus timonensis]
MNETVYLDVKELHCPDCPQKVEKAVSKLDGVSEIKVDYDTESGIVSFDNSLTSITDIINRINKMGFKASISEPTPVKE